MVLYPAGIVQPHDLDMLALFLPRSMQGDRNGAKIER